MPITRKAQFKAALAIAGMTMREWVADQGITMTHLQYVLTGERQSQRLQDEIDRFIEKHLRRTVAA